MQHDFIKIRKHCKGIHSSIPAVRVPIGRSGDYKPNIAVLPDGELLITAFHTNSEYIRKMTGASKGFREDILLFRSLDGGYTWSEANNLGANQNLLGREPYLTVLNNGTILLTCHYLVGEERNNRNYCANFIHRSTDKGNTWTTFEVTSKNMPIGTQYATTRNILEMSDGSLLLVITTSNRGAFLLTSTDSGLTWNETDRTQIEDLPVGYPYGVFEESHLLQLKSGRLLMISRVDHRYFPIKGRIINNEELNIINSLLTAANAAPITSLAETDYDQFNHLKIFTSDNNGVTWKAGSDIGDYGMMYPSITRLEGSRIILTYTVRHVNPPLGVRAVLGEEKAEELNFEFDQNIFMIDTKTPLLQHQGGGFGNTVHIGDGELLTPYSYRGEDGETHIEVVRWKLNSSFISSSAN